MQFIRVFSLVAALVAASALVDAAPTSKAGSASIEATAVAKPASAAPVTASLDDVLSKSVTKKVTSPQTSTPISSPGSALKKSQHVYPGEDDLPSLPLGTNATGSATIGGGNPFGNQQSTGALGQVDGERSFYDFSFEDDPLAASSHRHDHGHKYEDPEDYDDDEENSWHDFEEVYPENESSEDLATAIDYSQSEDRDRSGIHDGMFKDIEFSGDTDFRSAQDISKSNGMDGSGFDIDDDDVDFHSFSDSASTPLPGPSSLSTAPVTTSRAANSGNLDSSSDADSLDSSNDDDLPRTPSNPVKSNSPYPGVAGGISKTAKPAKATSGSTVSIGSSRAQ